MGRDGGDQNESRFVVFNGKEKKNIKPQRSPYAKVCVARGLFSGLPLLS
jgi:hypothetical protein